MSDQKNELPELSGPLPESREFGSQNTNRSCTSCLALMFVCSLALFLLGPFLVRENEMARRISCTNNLKQIAMALQQYREYYGSLPPAYTMDATGRPLHSWRVLILPFLEDVHDRNLYAGIRLDEPWDSEYNRTFFQGRSPQVYRCPSRSVNTGMDKTCFYSIVLGKWTPFSSPFVAGEAETSNRILIVERKTPINWTKPDEELTVEEVLVGIHSSTTGAGSAHPNVMNAAFEDGSVRALNDDIDPGILRVMLTGR